MASNRLKPFIRHLRKVLHPREEGRLTDGQLLGLYLNARDETALEALVRRHGKMVLSVCRRLLGNTHDAEDAFQATFLVLTRKAANVSPREAVGNWLHGVAYRTALEARTMNGRRRAHEQQVEYMPHPAVEPNEANGELREALDLELSRLPEKYRLPVVLCDLEGRPRKEVARQLGLAEGTLSSRLATARKLLAKRLAKYGSVCTSAAVAAVLSEAAAAGIPPALVISTVRVVAGGTTATVAALAQGVLKTMFLSKLKAVTWMTALAVSLSAGAVGLSVVSAQSGGGALFPQTGGATALTQNRKSTVAAEGALPAAKASRDDLDEIRLEIEALRKGLQATRERVRTLETELNAIKGRAGAAFSPDGTLHYSPDGIRVFTAPSGGVGTTTRGVQGVPSQSGVGAGPGLGGGKPKISATAPTKEQLAIWVLEGKAADPLAELEGALKKLRENPSDKASLRALERAVQHLKANTKPATTVPAPK